VPFPSQAPWWATSRQVVCEAEGAILA
jgi:hypothetical protein